MVEWFLCVQNNTEKVHENVQTQRHPPALVQIFNTVFGVISARIKQKAMVLTIQIKLVFFRHLGVFSLVAFYSAFIVFSVWSAMLFLTSFKRKET